MSRADGIFYKTDEEVELIRTNCLMVSKTLALVGELIRPGVKGLDIDAQAEQLIRDNGGVPGFKGYRGFPATLCISVNEQVVHGIPSDIEFKDGDVVSVDCGVLMNGYYGDAAYTFALGDVKEEVMQLLRVTKASLYKGIQQAIVGKRVGDISSAVQHYSERIHKYGVVRELVGHGLGRNLHEAPEVPNFGRRGQGPKMLDGLVIAIEPMVNMGVKEVETLDDDWTVVSKDRLPSAHYEHSVVVRKGQADILSTHKYVEESIRKNPNLKEVSDLIALPVV